MVVRKVTLNGNRGEPAIAAEWIRALNDGLILTKKAGFLFKASWDEDHLMLAVAPCLINGERSYHYNQHLEKEDAFTLIGEVSAQGVFTILFKPESREFAIQQAGRYIDLFRRFAEFLRQGGYAGEGKLDDVTQGVLKSLGMNCPPETLDELL
ncbi:MAG: hypothetical protein JEZ10_01260 [Verrucomicrobia bacterium]|nr:hypothetical protein [Verrucomicrobiota bacterium]